MSFGMNKDKSVNDTFSVFLQQSPKATLSEWVFLFATDTVYGVGCVLGKKEALDRLYELKQRPENQPMQLLVASREMAEKWVNISEDQPIDFHSRLYYASSYGLEHLDERLIKNKKVLIRQPEHQALLSAITNVELPIVASSANSRGQPSCTTEAEAMRVFSELPLWVGEDCSGNGQSSQIWDMTQNPAYRLR